MNDTTGTPDPPPPGPPSDRREQAALDALRTVVRDFIKSRFPAEAFQGKDLALSLHLRARFGQNVDLRFDPPLPEQLAEQGAEAEAAWQIYQAGRVFCFRCASSACEHSLPPNPLSVFRGYNAQGCPQWSELAQALLDARDPRIDWLLEVGPRMAAMVVTGSELRAEQLSSFGRASRTYSILGQVVAGYFHLESLGRREGMDSRLAVTFQVVETREAGGVMALHLNPVTGVPGGASLDELHAAGWEEWVQRARRLASTGLSAIESRARKARAARDTQGIKAAMREIPAQLRRFAASLERGDRQSRRRTQHAQERREQRRPIQMAMADAGRAGDSRLLYDEKSGTCIVCGEHGRFHVFSAEGRHITSFVGTEESLGFRLRTGRWREMTESEREQLREQLR